MDQMSQEEINYRRLVKSIGIGFHCDTRGDDYDPPLEDPAQYESIIDAAISAGVQIYAVALDVFEEEGWA